MAAGMAVLLSAAIAAACNVPVFRYALERWQNDLYHVVVFHKGELAGEDKPIEIHVNEYSLERRSDGATLTIVDAVASREWLTEVLRQFVIGQSFTIPDRAAAILNLLT